MRVAKWCRLQIGAGVQVPPNAARELIRWGLEDEMEKISSKPTLLNYRNWKTGEAHGSSKLSNHKARYRAPYWQVFRPDYHTILLKAALKAGATLRSGCTVIGYEAEKGTVILQSGEKVVGDLIVACDGVKSIARKAIGQNVEPHETGDTCFRAVIPGEVLLQDPELAPLVRDPGFEQWLGPDHHIIGYVSSTCLIRTRLIGIIRYNMQKEKTYNLLMVIPDDHSMVGYKAPASASEVRKAFKGWNPVLVPQLRAVPK